MHGQGVMIMSDGSSYEGSWVEDEYEGFGVFKWSDGEIYEGN